MLQHADSEGTLLGDWCSLQPATSVSTLASSLGDPESERLGVEDFIPSGESLEHLNSAESDPKLASSPTEMEFEQKAVEKESCKEDALMEGDQVADFASSVLAAISCWHYRARALLPTPFTTVRVSDTYGFLAPFLWLTITNAPLFFLHWHLFSSPFCCCCCF